MVLAVFVGRHLLLYPLLVVVLLLLLLIAYCLLLIAYCIDFVVFCIAMSLKKNPGNVFECLVCYSEYKENNVHRRLECSRCQYVVCCHCQKSYCKADCMNCHLEFSFLYITLKLGKGYFAKVLKPAVIAGLLVEEKRILPELAPLVKWKRMVEAIRSRVRFGEVYVIPPKPLGGRGGFPCPRSECRGYYYFYGVSCSGSGDADAAAVDADTVGDADAAVDAVVSCEECKYMICGRCEVVLGRENENGKMHVCDVNLLENRKAILEETKPCPKCRTRIFRTAGCSHMKCTFCQTFFDWESGLITESTTNFHYEGLQHQIRRVGSGEVGGGEVVGGGGGGGGHEDCFNEITELPLISRDVMFAARPGLFEDVGWGLDALYQESADVRFLKFSKYNEMKLLETKEEKRQELQLDFLMDRLSEKDWGVRLYTLVRNYKRDLNLARIYHLYLACVDQILSDFYGGGLEWSAGLGMYRSLIGMCVGCLESLVSEFGVFDCWKFSAMGGHEKIVESVGGDVVGGDLDGGDVVESVGGEVVCEENTMCPPTEEHGNGKAIELYPYQQKHVETLCSVFRRNYYALDLSMLGTGKTYSASAIYQEKAFGFEYMIVVAPVAVLMKWKDVVAEYGLKNVTLISYAEMRSVRGKQPKHGLLSRRDYFDEIPVLDRWGDFHGEMRMIPKVSFTATAKYLDMVVGHRTLLVFDEFQNLKNYGDQASSAAALIAGFGSGSGVGWRTSKVLLMSGSPMDKREHFVRLMRTLGVLDTDKLVDYHVHSGRFSYEGVGLIYDHIWRLSGVQGYRSGLVHGVGSFRRDRMWVSRALEDGSGVDLVREYRWVNIDARGDVLGVGARRKWMVMDEMHGRPSGWVHINADHATDICFEYFVRFLKPFVSSTMIPESNLMESEKVTAVYHVLSGSDRVLIDSGLSKLSKVVNTMFETGFANLQQRRIAIIEGQRMIETGMIGTMVRVCRDRLLGDPCLKVVISVNFSDTILDLMTMLAEFSPLEYSGKISRVRREEALKSFQEPSVRCRLLIGNLTCLSTGIDLDDKDGRFPRLCLSRPNYSTITLYQLSHRFNRGLDTRSAARVEFLYGGGDVGLDVSGGGHEEILEKKLLKSLARKGGIMKEVSSEQCKAGVLFPGEYNVWYED